MATKPKLKLVGEDGNASSASARSLAGWKESLLACPVSPKPKPGASSPGRTEMFSTL